MSKAKGKTGKSVTTRILEALEERGLEFMGKYYSYYRAFVYDTKDPLNMDRLLLIIPAVTGELPHGEWAYPIGQMAGKNSSGAYGNSFLPEKNDMVWVAFEQGDPDHPLWFHGHLGKGEKPEIKETNGKSYYFIDPSGNLLSINNTDGIIYIKQAEGTTVRLEKKLLACLSDHVELGSLDGDKVPAVLGDKNEEVLKALANGVLDIIDAINTAAVATDNSGATFKSNLIAALIETKGKIETTLNTSIENTKSKNVSLD